MMRRRRHPAGVKIAKKGVMVAREVPAREGNASQEKFR